MFDVQVEQREIFRSIVTVATVPPQVFGGQGLTRDSAEDDAARTALTTLFPHNQIRPSATDFQVIPHFALTVFL